MITGRAQTLVACDTHANGSCPGLLQQPLQRLHSCRRRQHVGCLWAAAQQHADTEIRTLQKEPAATPSAGAKATVEQSRQWAASVRAVTGRSKHVTWQPQLDPAALLSGVAVVLVEPKRPRTAGVVARALNSFECEELRVVAPRCNILSRGALTPSRGSQWILHKATLHDDLAAALAGTDLAIAFTRWAHGRPNCYRGMNELLAAHNELVHWPDREVPGVLPQASSSSAVGHAELHANRATAVDTYSRCSSSADMRVSAGSGSSSASSSSSSSSGGGSESSINSCGGLHSGHDRHHQSGVQFSARAPKLALVFGREDLGLTHEEVALCGAWCSLPTGRLQESLSLSHAVVMALSAIFEQRLAHMPKSIRAQYDMISAMDLPTHGPNHSE